MSPTRPFLLLDAPPPPTELHITGVAGLVIEGSTAECQVVFDTTVEEPLLDPAVEGSDLGKWLLIFGGNLYHCTAMMLVDFQRIGFTFELDGAAIGMDGIAYSNSPSDIADTLGRALPATSWPL